MSATAHITSHRSGFNPLGSLFGLILPEHGRRILFVTSLYFRITHLEKLKEEAISRLNVIMRLSTTDSSMHFPAILSKFLWRNVPIDEIIHLDQDCRSIDDVDRVSTIVAECAPRWMRYGSKETMTEDVKKIIAESLIVEREAA